MAHNHENCTTVYGCEDGMIFGPCSEDCPSDDCAIVGHCDCKCHTNKTCGCGFKWPLQ